MAPLAGFDQRAKRCHALGCSVDLFSEDGISQRSGTCLAHRKALVITVKGVQSRYCQQCGRVHALDRFDDDKRGCRKRLASHSRRRRMKRRAQATDQAGDEASADQGTEIGPKKAEEQRTGSQGETSRASKDSSSSPAFQALDPAGKSKARPGASHQGTACSNESIPRDVSSWFRNVVVPKSSPQSSVTTVDDLLKDRLFAEDAADCFTWLSTSGELVQSAKRQKKQDRWSDSAEGEPPGNSRGGSFDSKADPFADSWPSLFPSTYSGLGAVGKPVQRNLYAPQLVSESHHPAKNLDDSTIFSPWALSASRDYPMASSKRPASLQSVPADPFFKAFKDIMGGLSDEALSAYGSFVPPVAPASISMKMRDATPADLPFTIREDIYGCFQTVPATMQGSIRPGCVHLTLDMTFSDLPDMNKAIANFAASLEAGPQWLCKNSAVALPHMLVEVREGCIIAQASEGVPEIMSWGPIAPADTIALRLANIKSDLNYKVHLRMDGCFHTPTILKAVMYEDGTTLILLSLPPLRAGLAWIDVESDCSQRGFFLSNSVPILITSSPAVQSELSEVVPSRFSNVQDIAVLLQGFADILHPRDGGSKYAPWVFMETVRLGLSATAEEVAFAADDVSDRGLHDLLTECTLIGEGVLTAAVVSGSLDTLSLVLDLMQLEGVPIEACRISNATNTTALHLAAMTGSMEFAELILQHSSEANQQWASLKAAPNDKTPSEILSLRQKEIITSSGQFDPSIRMQDSLPTDDVSSTSLSPERNVLNFLTSWTGRLSVTTAHLSYFAMLGHDWRLHAPALAFSMILFLAVLPALYWTVVLPAVYRVRKAARKVGATVTEHLWITDQGLQEAYCRGMTSSGMGGRLDLLQVLALICWFTLAPVGHAYHHHGVFCIWSLLPPVALAAILMPLRIYFGSTATCSLRHTINTIMNIVIFMSGSIPPVVCTWLGVRDPTLPLAFLNSDPLGHAFDVFGIVFFVTVIRAFFLPHHMSLTWQAVFSIIFLGAIIPIMIKNASSFSGVSHSHTFITAAVAHFSGSIATALLKIRWESRALIKFFEILESGKQPRFS